jgi:ATP-dependent Clp protease ATP-binding subunit ClpA
MNRTKPLKRVLQKLIQDSLAKGILEGKFPPDTVVLGDVDESGEGLAFTKKR